MSGVLTRLPVHAPAPAVACMRADRDMIDALARSGGPDRLARVFTWRDPAASWGRSQPASRQAGEWLAARRIESVVRPTGGAVLLHGPGLDVSFSAGVRRPRGHGVLDLVEAGRSLAAPVLAGVRALGVDAAFRDCALCGTAGENALFPLCFLQKTPFDLLVGGRKIAAFALRRTGNAIFLHGSVLIGAVPRDMVVTMIEAGIGSGKEWDRAQAGIGYVRTDPSRLAEAIAASG